MRGFTIFLCTCIIKNILEYAQIARNETESKIPYIESHSNTYYIECITNCHFSCGFLSPLLHLVVHTYKEPGVYQIGGNLGAIPQQIRPNTAANWHEARSVTKGCWFGLGCSIVFLIGKVNYTQNVQTNSIPYFKLWQTVFHKLR